ncbi:MAG: TRASH domain-containing protein, partial [bacterium]|nr:TRASH domain-containing protein [bacterium]
MNESLCDLCGLSLPPKPSSTEWNNKTYRFCCAGCRQVFVILAESGLLQGDFKDSEIYQTSLKLGIISRPAAQSSDRAEEAESTLLDPETIKHSKVLTLHISGMWCSACSWLIDNVVSAEKGVVHIQVLFAADTAKIQYLPQIISAEKIKTQIHQLGYNAVGRDEATGEIAKERKQLLLRMGTAIFFAVNIMMFNAVIYIGYFEEISAAISRLIVLLLWALATPAVLWCGLPVHKKAYYSLTAKTPTMEVLLSTGIFTAYFYSIYMFFINDPHVYFDTSANLVALILVGKFFETSARHKATDGIHRLYVMLPKKVRIKTAN